MLVQSEMEAIKDYLQSLLHNDILVQSRLRIRDNTIVSVVSTCVMDELDSVDDVDNEFVLYTLRIVWIAARILMTNGGKTISMFTPSNEYGSKDIVTVCNKMYYLCKAYNIDIPQYDSVPLEFK